MYDTAPPPLETFDHWPSWLNARGHLDRSACFELKVSDLRRISGCVPMQARKGDMTGKQYRAKGRERFGVPDLPNARRARNGKGRLSCGWYDLTAYEMDELARGYFPRRLGGDWRTGRAPAMRPERTNRPGMSLVQGGYGPGHRSYELDQAMAAYEALFGGADEAEAERLVPWLESPLFERPPRGVPLDAGLEGNPNRGASREKRFGLDDDWVQRVGMEKWARVGCGPKVPASLRVQYFLICPGAGVPDASLRSASACPARSTVDAKGLKGLTGTTSNCGDGSKGAHGKGWVCGQRVYKWQIQFRSATPGKALRTSSGVR